MAKKKSNQKANKMDKKQRKLFERCYFEDRSKIYWYIYKKVNKQALAEDIAAEVFMKLAESPHILEDRDDNGVRAWLYTVARNKVIDYYRKQGRARQKVELEEEIFNIVAKEDGEYLESAIEQEEIEILMATVEGLNAMEKEIISLRFNDEMQFSEIAEIIGKTEGAVKMALYRALEKLKEKLENKYDYQSDN